MVSFLIILVLVKSTVNILEGEYISYHEYEFNIVKQIKIKKNYVNGKVDGEFSEYHENGELKNLGFYNNGKIEGKYYFFDRKGNIKEKRLYKDGNLIRVIKIN